MSEHVDVKVMMLNCASFKARWALRAVILIRRLLRNAPDVITCVELYATRRARLTRGLARRYACVGTYRGKVIYVRRGAVGVHRGSLLRMNLGNGKHALAVRLVDASTGALFVVVVAHLSWQISYDSRRHAQTQRLITLVQRRYGTSVPTIYTGDWNSSIHRGKRKRDAVGEVFKASGLTEAYVTADRRANTKWNSANRFRRPAPASRIHLDRAFGDAVEFLLWRLDYYPGRYGSDHFGLVVVARIPY